MLSAGNKLSLLDACMLLSVMLAVAGHLWLGVSAAASRSYWPMRQGEASAIITFMAGVSIVLGIVGATQGLGFAPTPLINDEGLQVNGPLEFVLIAIFCTLPAWTLLILRFIAYRPARRSMSHRLVKKPIVPTNILTGSSAPFTIALLGNYAPAQIKCHWQDAPPIFPSSTVEHITSAWDAAQRQAHNNQRQLFNGDLIRLIAAKVHCDALHLTLSPTCYRDFVGTNLNRTYHDLPIEQKVFANALGMSVVPVTTDGFIVLGLRNDTVIYHAGWIHTIGGMLEDIDRTEKQVAIVGCALRELSEELLVKENECQPLDMIALACDTSLLQPELILTTQLSLTRRELENRFDASLVGQEHSQLVFVHDSPDEIIPFISRSPQLTPLAQAALLTLGYHDWGQEWYEQTSLLLYDSLPQRVDWRE